MLKYIFYSFLLLVTSTGFANDYLANRIHQRDKRHSTFSACLSLLENRNAKILVETGTARNGTKNCTGDGCSTIIFADWAKANGATLFSVDINPAAIRESEKESARSIRKFNLLLKNSVEFLEEFEQPIDFLYLDSYDFEIHNPRPSQLHHLREIEAAYPFLHKDSVIMIDDCNQAHGGKGKLVIDFLTARGWTLFIYSYQAILIYKGN